VDVKSYSGAGQIQADLLETDPLDVGVRRVLVFHGTRSARGDETLKLRDILESLRAPEVAE